MRRSLSDLPANLVYEDNNYPKLPDELKPFAYYVADSGHSIMAIPECLLAEAAKDGDIDMFEVPMPTKYVLTVGYRIICDHVVVEAKYDDMLGLQIDTKYDEL